jgi:hypothetical protein
MDSAAYKYRDLPFTAAVAETMIREMLDAGEVTLFRRNDIATMLRDKHVANGGREGAANLLATVKKALGNLKAKGVLENPGYGTWRATADVAVEATVVVQLPVVATPTRLCVEQSVGEGEGAVYVYFFPNDRALAHAEGRNRWECKVGMSTTDPLSRIVDQVSTTATHALPVVGLLISTNEPLLLEQAIHSALRFAGRQIRPSAGSEWFNTNVEEVLAIREMLVGLTK